MRAARAGGQTSSISARDPSFEASSVQFQTRHAATKLGLYWIRPRNGSVFGPGDVHCLQSVRNKQSEGGLVGLQSASATKAGCRRRDTRRSARAANAALPSRPRLPASLSVANTGLASAAQCRSQARQRTSRARRRGGVMAAARAFAGRTPSSVARPPPPPRRRARLRGTPHGAAAVPRLAIALFAAAAATAAAAAWLRGRAGGGGDGAAPAAVACEDRPLMGKIYLASRALTGLSLGFDRPLLHGGGLAGVAALLGLQPLFACMCGCDCLQGGRGGARGPAGGARQGRGRSGVV